MAASSHGSRWLTVEEVLEEVLADRDSEFSDEESEDGLNIMTIALAPKKMEEDAAPNKGEGRVRGVLGGGRSGRGWRKRRSWCSKGWSW